MDLQKYERAFDKLPKTVITKQFGNDESQFDHAKKQMLEIFENTNHEYPSTYQPFFIPYFMKNLLFLCQNSPEFVGYILYKNSNQKFSVLAGLIGAASTTLVYNTPAKKTIKTAESLYQEAHKKLTKIKSSSTILKKDINEVLKIIEPISIAKNYNKNILQAYYKMYLELRISLQLLSRFEDINKTFDFDMSLADNDAPILDLLNHTNFNFDKYSKDPLMASILDDLKILYSKIDQSSQEPKTYELPEPPFNKASQISDSKQFIPTEEQLKIFSDFQNQHGFIARSEIMLDVFDFITRNKNDITILITGESGVGKEVLAKAIHHESNRRDKPFIAENCGGKDTGMLESTLFGHEKGSFTGAELQHKGIFEQADKGTIFLDEIGDMTLRMQVRLLRVLQERKVKRLGGEKEFPVDLRIICATNQDLKKAVELKSFREDLFHRINVASVEIPPLNVRRDDITYLAKHFFDKFQDKYITNQYHRAPTWITYNTFSLLKEISWQGNVRELENYMEVFVNNNKEDLSKLEPRMLKILFSDRSKTIKDLLKNPTEGDKIFRESKYFEILMSYIENHYDRVKTTKISGYHKDTVRSRLNSCMLQLGMEFEFQQKGMIDYLIDRKILIDDDREIFTMNITVIFKSIIASTLKGTKKTFFDPPDKQLVDNLFKLRNDLVTQVKKNTT